jgi:hypothetical protein
MGIFSPLKEHKKVNIGLGILASISIVSLAFPILHKVLILIISFALMFIGITRIPCNKTTAGAKMVTFFQRVLVSLV